MDRLQTFCYLVDRSVKGLVLFPLFVNHLVPLGLFLLFVFDMWHFLIEKLFQLNDKDLFINEGIHLDDNII